MDHVHYRFLPENIYHNYSVTEDAPIQADDTNWAALLLGLIVTIVVLIVLCVSLIVIYKIRNQMRRSKT